jgi:hypothetical protein
MCTARYIILHMKKYLFRKEIFDRADGVPLLLLMSVLSQTLFAFVGSHFALFSFFSAWHNFQFFVPLPLRRGVLNNYFKSFR